ncbi:hypothetical protein EIO_3258 (plasmid) [Ketogulonicigenium vulgare Y25]|nr:hypothetical protein EIO_3258 [Ketogulonicigenium vulgare Y25]
MKARADAEADAADIELDLFLEALNRRYHYPPAAIIMIFGPIRAPR